jgi:asparagine synthase (glutamine-hydrolysing)
MCGIAGVMTLNENQTEILQRIEDCAKAIAHRGPDNLSTVFYPKIAFAHSRLSIIDTSADSNQPLTDNSNEYTLVFNGEIFNYIEIRKLLVEKGAKFKTKGDAEVFLELFKSQGFEGLNLISGFFSAAIYHHPTETLRLFRDRYGVKPLYFYHNENTLIFSSEIRGIRATGVHLSLNKLAMSLYFQLNYIPGNVSIFQEVNKIPAGHYAVISSKGVDCLPYYSIDERIHSVAPDESAIKNQLKDLVETSIRDRLVADIPVGCFLSGGIDSTIVAGIAAREKSNLPTFCLGFSNNKWFDESHYAELAAKQFGTEHHTFRLSNEDLLNELDEFLLAQDEPFADSSALNVFILSKKTRNYVKTVLSGDGADEIFGGYNKHRAAWLIEHDHVTRVLGKIGKIAAGWLPASRNSAFGNKIRQWHKLSALIDLPTEERYWNMACIATKNESDALFQSGFKSENQEDFKRILLESVHKNQNLNGILLNDVKLVLENDMLVKIDRMSMANGLEIRSPFMDSRVVEFGLGISEKLKVNKKEGKLILKETFSDLIPKELLHRKKHGFEVPVQQWMKNELKEKIEKDLMSESYVREQGIFNYSAIKTLLEKVQSKNPGDSAARIWGLMLFNNWYRKNFN